MPKFRKSRTPTTPSRPRKSLKVKSKQGEQLPTYGGRTLVKGRRR
ncbi:MAG: hypothetical protein ACYS30_24835 [Planctomycetota bacterium]